MGILTTYIYVLYVVCKKTDVVKEGPCCGRSPQPRPFLFLYTHLKQYARLKDNRYPRLSSRKDAREHEALLEDNVRACNSILFYNSYNSCKTYLLGRMRYTDN